MTTTEVVGSVAGLWRFPVKSMSGERLDRAHITERGLLGDRAYALVESETGKVVTAKSVRQFPDLLDCQARFVEPPRLGQELPPVQIALPNGVSVMSDSGDVDRVLSAYFKREVTLARAAPEDYTIDQYHPDLENLDPVGHRDEFVEQKLGSALFGEIGADSPVPVGALFDAFPISVLTTSTLKRLAELLPESRIDNRRFRMNVIVDTKEPRYLENDWLGRELGIGATVKLAVTMPDPRCVMTTLAQDELPTDPDILRTLARHNRLRLGDDGLFPCAGVYAVVTSSGTVRTSDRVGLN